MIGKNNFAGKQLVKRAAQAVDIRANIDPMTIGDLLRGHVIGRTHDLPDAGRVAFCNQRALQSGQAQIEQFDQAVAGEHEIRGLDVAMHEPLLVNRLQAPRGLANHRAGRGDGQRPVAADDFLQVHAVDIFRDQEPRAADLPRIVGLDDVGMIDPPGRLHFAFEAAYQPGIAADPLGERLDGHQLVEPGVQRLVDGPHAAFPQLFQKPVLAQLGTLGKPAGRRLIQNIGSHQRQAGFALGTIPGRGFPGDTRQKRNLQAAGGTLPDMRGDAIRLRVRQVLAEKRR